MRLIVFVSLIMLLGSCSINSSFFKRKYTDLKTKKPVTDEMVISDGENPEEEISDIKSTKFPEKQGGVGCEEVVNREVTKDKPVTADDYESAENEQENIESVSDQDYVYKNDRTSTRGESRPHTIQKRLENSKGGDGAFMVAIGLIALATILIISAFGSILGAFWISTEFLLVLFGIALLSSIASLILFLIARKRANSRFRIVFSNIMCGVLIGILSISGVILLMALALSL